MMAADGRRLPHSDKAPKLDRTFGVHAVDFDSRMISGDIMVASIFWGFALNFSKIASRRIKPDDAPPKPRRPPSSAWLSKTSDCDANTRAATSPKEIG
ncbi:hypothetical protein DSM3645_29351 [Blastopirellula marina DSM 3645]|uniref:Uncharacterized protein n=1 Tax=Blastopirellula marina DSM 3645 TaxID=314230 RepID=A4A1R5_9BACT|nr:hypothetical protein DSM3645_29351 [Blastopirellula marina DSM 3645]